MCFIMDNVIANVNYNTILARRPRDRRICLGVRLKVTLIIGHIVAYTWPQFEKSLTHPISLIVLNFSYRVQGNVSFNEN